MIYLDDLRNATGAQLFGETAAREFIGFASDASTVQPGQLYVVLKSDHINSEQQISNAIASGATGVLCHEPPQGDVTGATIIVVGDTAAALGQWAAYVLRQYGTMVIGVTGVVGKSITASSIAAVLSTRYSVYHQKNNQSGREGLALSLGGLEPHHQIVILELSTNIYGEMADILAMAQPSIAVITRLTSRFQITRADSNRIEQEARQVIEALPEDGSLVLNYDDPPARDLVQYTSATVLRYGSTQRELPPTDLIATNVEYFVDKVGFDVLQGVSRLKAVWTPALGEPGLYAALAAIGVGLLLEIPLQVNLAALKNLQQLPGHLTVLDGVNGTTLIDDTANATVISAVAAIDLLGAIDLGGSRRIVVLGDLTSASDEIELEYQEVGRQAAQVADFLITCGENARLAGLAARQTRMSENHTILLDRQADVVNSVRGLIQPADCILLLGGRAARIESITRQLLAVPEDAGLIVEHAAYEVTLPRSAGSWIQLDLDALAQNLNEIKERVGQAVEVLAVVKGNAYGHGAVQIATTAMHNGASMLGVATAAEALHLRQMGINVPILVMSYVPQTAAHLVVEHDLTVTLYDRDTARLLALAAHELGKQARVHIRVDSGLGDLGLLPQDVVPLVRELMRIEDIVVDGIYTNFAAADTLFEAAYTHEQLQRFQSVVGSLRAAGLSIPHIHAADSAAILTIPASYFTMVRAGICMYGLNPSIDVSCPPTTQRVLSWVTRVAQIKTVPAGWPIGYGAEFRTEQETRLAMIPVGYADGFRSLPRNWGEVLVNGKRARLLGRVAMDRCAIDVSHLPNVRLGDEVVLIGVQGNDEIRVEDVARRLDCTNYEVVASLSPLIPRIIIGS